jgi:hypothetical protein
MQTLTSFLDFFAPHPRNPLIKNWTKSTRAPFWSRRILAAELLGEGSKSPPPIYLSLFDSPWFGAPLKPVSPTTGPRELAIDLAGASPDRAASSRE